MKFECGDLERALATPDLMPDALAHAKTCPACRRELRLWNEISRAASQLHEEWDSPGLWPRIREALEAEPRPARHWWRSWYWMAAPVAAAAIWLLMLLRPSPSYAPPKDRQFLTEQALREVEQNEAAYRKSIDKLSALADPKLEKSASPISASYSEKLVLLDSAIADVTHTLARNRFNAQLRTELAGLYRDKQKTLQEILTSDSKN